LDGSGYMHTEVVWVRRGVLDQCRVIRLTTITRDWTVGRWTLAGIASRRMNDGGGVHGAGVLGISEEDKSSR